MIIDFNIYYEDNKILCGNSDQSGYFSKEKNTKRNKPTRYSRTLEK